MRPVTEEEGGAARYVSGHPAADRPRCRGAAWWVAGGIVVKCRIRDLAGRPPQPQRGGPSTVLTTKRSSHGIAGSFRHRVGQADGIAACAGGVMLRSVGDDEEREGSFEAAPRESTPGDRAARGGRAHVVEVHDCTSGRHLGHPASAHVTGAPVRHQSTRGAPSWAQRFNTTTPRYRSGAHEGR